MIPTEFKKALYSGAFLLPRFRKRYILVPLLFLSLLASTTTVANETVTVRHVLDGDSFILADGRQARLIGVNAPEFGKDGAPDQPLAKQARNRLAGLLKNRRVNLSFEHERRDRYGRWLVHARLPDGGSAEEILLREGLAWAVAIPPNVDQLDILLKAENEARTASRGVWGEPAYAPKPANDLTAKDTGFRFIEGTILRRTQGRQVIYLDLAPHVALVVPREDWKKYFESRSDDWIGRRVIARGWLTEHRGRLHLRVPHPAMLTWRD